MGILSEFAGGSEEMSDVTLARKLVADIAGDCWDGKGNAIERAYDALQAHLPRDKRRRWTKRRVRSFFHQEAAGVRYHEMRELAEVAQAERERRHEIEEARRDHADYISRTIALVDRLAVQDEEFHREHIEALRTVSGGKTDPEI